MSENNKAILEAANAAIAEGNYEGFLSFCTDDTQWTFVGDKTLNGKEAVRQWMLTEYVEPPLNIVANLIAEGDFVTAVGDLTIKDEDGKAAHYSYCDVWRFRGGKMVELRAFVIKTESKDIVTMSQVFGKSIIITGASSGIGEATAKLLAEHGAKLMLAARREDRLEKLVAEIESAGGTATYQTADVTQCNQVEALAKTTLEQYGKIDVLINNAGIMPLSRLDQLKVDEWERTIDINIKGVLYGIAAVLPHMQKAQSGHIINIASVAGHKVYPSSAVYCSTKFAVRAISEGLRQEVGAHIRSTIISPGAVATELTNSISDPEAAKNIDALYEMAIQPEAIAQAIRYAIEQPKEVDVNEILIRPTAQEL